MSDLRILVTGSSGFTGKYVVPALLEAGFEVCFLKADLQNEEAVMAEIRALKPNAMLHLAGVAYVGHGNLADFYRVNLIGTLGLLQALDKVGSISGPVVLASSANIYGNAYQTEPIKETFLPRPLNDYALSKLAMEEMSLLWKDRLPITIVRPFNYTGVGQSSTFVIPKIIQAFGMKKKVLNLGNINVWRDFSDVRDIARWYTEIFKLGLFGVTVNFCSGKKISIKDIISKCHELTKHDVEVKTTQHLIRENEIISLCGDRAYLDTLLNQNSVANFGIEDTLRWMIQSYSRL